MQIWQMQGKVACGEANPIGYVLQDSCLDLHVVEESTCSLQDGDVIQSHDRFKNTMISLINISIKVSKYIFNYLYFLRIDVFTYILQKIYSLRKRARFIEFKGSNGTQIGV